MQLRHVRFVPMRRHAAASFDDLIGSQREARGNVYTERFCGLEIDDQLKVGRLLDRQIRRLCALENLPDIDADPTIKRGQTLQRCLAEWESHGRIDPANTGRHIAPGPR